MTSRRSATTKPVLVDNLLNRFFAVKYVLYAMFGLSGIILQALSLVMGQFTALIVAAIVTISSTLAAISAWNSIKGGAWIKIEFYSTIVMLVFVSVFVASMIYLVLLGQFNQMSVSIISSALLVMPIWRITDIIKKSHPSR